MSNLSTFYVMIGIKVYPEELGIEDIWDDKWLPYIEGHEGIEFSMINFEGEVCIGKILNKWNRYSPSYQFKEYVPDSKLFKKVDSFLLKEFKYAGQSAKLLMFCIHEG